MKWRRVRLGEVLDIKHGFAFKGEHFSNEGQYLLLTPGNCEPNGGLKLREGKEKYYTGEFPIEYLLESGELLVVMTDLVNSAPILGGSFLISEGNRFLHNQRLGLVCIKDERKVNKTFLHFLLNTHAYRAQVRGSASGATVKHTSPGRIKNCTVSMPDDIKHQQEIGQILTNYNALIETNLRRIKLLERSARLLYKEWFVRLRFPGSDHHANTKKIPKDWTSVRLGDLCEDVKRFISPNELEPSTPYIGLEHMPRRSICLNEWGSANDVSSTKLLFDEGEILFGKIRPYFHKVGIAFLDGVASSDIIVIRPTQSDLRHFVLMTVSSDPFVAMTAQTMKEGSKMPRADWKQMREYKVALPPAGLLKEFESIIKGFAEQLKILTFANVRLSAARNHMLPRLMNGEIRV